MAVPHLLEVRGLKTQFATDNGVIHAVDGVDLSIDRGETLGVVGESGCGKSVTAMSVMKLIPSPPGRIAAGEILWQGRDLVPLEPEEMYKLRSKEIAVVFQEPMTSLNPVYAIGDQIAEVIRLHRASGAASPSTKLSRCSSWFASRNPSAGSATIRTSSPAACGRES